MTDTLFPDGSVVELLIPQASDLDIEEILQAASDTNADNLIPSIKQRELLFFDEILPVYAVLRTTYEDEQAIKDRVAGLTVGIEAHAVSSTGSHDPNRDRQSSSGPTRDIVWSGKVDVTADPVTLVIGMAEQGQMILLVWKTTVILSRPRTRLSSPSIIFKISASVRSTLTKEIPKPDPYLPSGIPLALNILQPLSSDGLPHLSAQRLTKRQPNARRQLGETTEITTIAPRPCRIMPALSSRIRAQKAPFKSETPSMIGSLEIDVPPFAPYPLKITAVDLVLAHGKVVPIGDGQIPKFPAVLYARDQIVCLYKLLQDGQAEGKSILPLQVMINVSIDVAKDCHPQIQVRFQAMVDMAEGPKEEKIKQAQVAPGDQLPDSVSVTQPSATEEKLGVVVKLTAKNPVYVGEPFYWEVFVMNRSGRQRRLGLSMLHKRRLPAEKRIPSRPTSISGQQQLLEPHASPFADDNLLYTEMKNYHRDVTQLICLNTDIKIGPLNPGSCYTTQMEFLALARGLLPIDAIRLTDYTTNEAVDLCQLPDVFAFSRK